MPLQLYPDDIPGLTWSAIKTPKFATRIQKGVSGRELRVADQPYPTWEWTLTYSLLRDLNDARQATGPGTGFDELRKLMGFYCAQSGSFRAFNFNDHTDNFTRDEEIGTGNGVETQFQLVRTIGGFGFSEPIVSPWAVSIYVDDVPVPGSGNWTVDTETGIVTFLSPPAAAAVITADLNYYFRVRFSDDTAEFENFMFQLWEMKQIKFQSDFL